MWLRRGELHKWPLVFEQSQLCAMCVQLTKMVNRLKETSYLHNNKQWLWFELHSDQPARCLSSWAACGDALPRLDQWPVASNWLTPGRLQASWDLAGDLHGENTLAAVPGQVDKARSRWCSASGGTHDDSLKGCAPDGMEQGLCRLAVDSSVSLHHLLCG